jgi:hypothetical protein
MDPATTQQLATLAAQNQAPAMLVFFLLLTVLRHAASRLPTMSAQGSALRPAPSPTAPARPATRPHLPPLAAAPSAGRRRRAVAPHAAPQPPAPPNPEPRRKRSAVPLPLRPVFWALRVALSPVGVLAAVRGPLRRAAPRRPDLA